MPRYGHLFISHDLKAAERLVLQLPKTIRFDPKKLENLGVPSGTTRLRKQRLLTNKEISPVDPHIDLSLASMSSAAGAAAAVVNLAMRNRAGKELIEPRGGSNLLPDGGVCLERRR